MAEQKVCSGPPLLLHKHLPQEVPASVGHTLGKRGLCRLGGDLKNGCHGFVLGPRGFLGQHLNNGAGDTPEGKQHSRKNDLNGARLVSIVYLAPPTVVSNTRVNPLTRAQIQTNLFQYCTLSLKLGATNNALEQWAQKLLNLTKIDMGDA